jgi:hypothetical protein
MILEEPIEAWPLCDCLLSWHSDGFPLAKAQAYVQARRPFCVNDMMSQDRLLDRREVYRILQVGAGAVCCGWVYRILQVGVVYRGCADAWWVGVQDTVGWNGWLLAPGAWCLLEWWVVHDTAGGGQC